MMVFPTILLLLKRFELKTTLKALILTLLLDQTKSSDFYFQELIYHFRKFSELVMEHRTIKVAPRFLSLNIVIVLRHRIYIFVLFKYHIFFCALIILQLPDFLYFVTKGQVYITIRRGFLLLNNGEKDGPFFRFWHTRQLKTIIGRT